MGFRCCDRGAQDLQPSFASVCYLGQDTIESKLDELETKIRPSFTGWCSRCCAVSTLTKDAHKFQKPSAYYTHLLATNERFDEYSIFKP